MARFFKIGIMSPDDMFRESAEKFFAENYIDVRFPGSKNEENPYTKMARSIDELAYKNFITDAREGVFNEDAYNYLVKRSPAVVHDGFEAKRYMDIFNEEAVKNGH